MIFTDYTASIPLQSLCDHTAQRLSQVQNDVLCIIEKCDLILLHYKACFDGSTGQSICKEKMSVDSLRDLKKEKSLFFNLPCSTSNYNSVRETQTVIWRRPYDYKIIIKSNICAFISKLNQTVLCFCSRVFFLNQNIAAIFNVVCSLFWTTGFKTSFTLLFCVIINDLCSTKNFFRF